MRRTQGRPASSEATSSMGSPRHGADGTVYDNFSTGQEYFIGRHAGNPKVRIVCADVLDSVIFDF